MVRPLRIGWALLLVASLGAPTSIAQNVHYSGTLRIGYSDADNTAPGIGIDAGWPECDVLPHDPAGTTNQTFGTLLVNGRGTQVGSGPGADLVFEAVGAGNGGAQVVTGDRCRRGLSGPNLQLRSFTEITSVRWPANVGSFMKTQTVLSSPASPTATYRLSAGGGLPFTGSTLMTPNPILFPISGGGAFELTKGANHFGGGAPIQFRKRVRAGQHTAIGTFGSFPPPYTYGSRRYVQGTVDIWPLPIGDAGLDRITIPTAGTMYTNPAGLLVSTPTPFDSLAPPWALRTPGGTTKDQHGAIVTLGGGNTVTPSGTWMVGTTTLDCVTGIPSPCPRIVGFLNHQAALFAWTTGRVQISDMVGQWATVRSASGFDVATSGPHGTTRRLQLVSPFTSALRAFGDPFGLPIPEDVVSGVAVLELKVIPVPEPAGLAVVAAGLLGAAAVGWRRRRRDREERSTR